LIVPEQMLSGTITFRDYYNLFKFGPGVFGIIIFAIICICAALF